MNLLSKTWLAAAALVWSVTVCAAEGVDIRRTAPYNTLVRITGSERYVILPIEERIPDARIDVLVDGRVAQTIYARLARHHVDYAVPFDLTPYTSQGSVVLNVVEAADAAPADNTAYDSRHRKPHICWKEIRLADTFDTANVEKFRPAYHHTPRYGWMNDPNGMFWKDGLWHLYFQYNPYGSKWQNMTWGHSTSRDLVHWEQQPNAIEPNGLGSVFSGSAVVDAQNTAGFGKDEVVAIYTSAGASQVQSLAHSGDDGATFTIYGGNPILTTPGEARDPNMFWNEQTGRWNLVLAHALDHEILFYSSENLIDWTFESAFGRGYGCQKGVWECPDLFQLPVRGTDRKKWVLIVNINPGGPFGGSATQYFVGEFDGHEFVCDDYADEAKWLDYGKDHYAAVTWSGAPGGRRTAIAWMSNWEYADAVPTMQFRSANTLPRELDLFRARDGELYVGVKPSPEVETLRGAKQQFGAQQLASQAVGYELPADGLCEIDLDLSFDKAHTVNIVLSNDCGESLTMLYDLRGNRHQFTMHRQNSGDTSFSDHFPATTAAPMLSLGRKASLRLFLDRCSIEAFDGKGRFAMTTLVFPTAPYTRMSIYTTGGEARADQVTIYALNN